MKTILITMSLFLATITISLANSVSEPINILVGGSDSIGADVSNVKSPALHAKGNVETFALTRNTGVNIYITAVLGPVRHNTNSFEPWSTSAVPAYYGGHMPSDILTHLLIPSNIIQNAEQTNNTIWFLVHVVSKDPAYKFLPSRLSFLGGSSDIPNYLSTVSSLSSDPSFTFSPRCWGINWGSGGPRVNDTILFTAGDGKLSEVPVNEFIFIGAQLNYFMADYSDWINGFSDYSVFGTWSLSDGTNIIAHASKMLHTKATVSMPWISLSVTNSDAVIGASMGTHDSAILYSSSRIPPIWKSEGVMNSGDIILIPKNTTQCYFKLMLQ